MFGMLARLMFKETNLVCQHTRNLWPVDMGRLDQPDTRQSACESPRWHSVKTGGHPFKIQLRVLSRRSSIDYLMKGRRTCSDIGIFGAIIGKIGQNEGTEFSSGP